MGQLSTMFNGLARSFSTKKKRRDLKRINGGIEAAEAMAYEAKKNGLILKKIGNVNVDKSKNFAAVFSRRGEKGINQDCCIVWEGAIIPAIMHRIPSELRSSACLGTNAPNPIRTLKFNVLGRE